MVIVLIGLGDNFKKKLSASFRELGGIGHVFQGGYIAIFNLVVQ